MENNISEVEFQEERKRTKLKLNFSFWIIITVAILSLISAIIGFTYYVPNVPIEEAFPLTWLGITGIVMLCLSIIALMPLTNFMIKFKLSSARALQKSPQNNQQNTFASAESTNIVKKSRQLDEIDELLKNKKITQEEYDSMRKKILEL